jgi:hypothetical protein
MTAKRWIAGSEAEARLASGEDRKLARVVCKGALNLFRFHQVDRASGHMAASINTGSWRTAPPDPSHYKISETIRDRKNNAG